jgi:N-acyl-D-aspartate/D-glutamate deacylase
MGNLLIKNGLIIDGTGREAFTGDVVVAEDRIESVISSDTPPGMICWHWRGRPPTAGVY